MSTCQWCADVFTSNTSKAIHVHEAHPDTIGRGPTRSALVHCWRCAQPNQPEATRCTTCGYTKEIN